MLDIQMQYHVIVCHHDANLPCPLIQPIFFSAIQLACRMILAIFLIVARGGVWVLEQPSSSLVFRHPRFKELLGLTTVT